MNCTSPFTFSGRCLGCGVSCTLLSVARTSAMRPGRDGGAGHHHEHHADHEEAHNDLHGVLDEGHHVAHLHGGICAIWWPPTQTISRETPFITSIITGIIVAMARLTRTGCCRQGPCWLCRSVSASKSCVANARMTIMPERFSRLTRFSLSTSCCMILKRGMRDGEQHAE